MLKGKGGIWNLILVSISIFVLVSCGKDDNEYELVLTKENGAAFDWVSDKIDGAILNDTLIIAASQKSGSGVSIIVADNEVGDYEIALNNIEAFVTYDITGQKEPSETYLSAGGTLSILEKNTDKKTIRGTFLINAVNGLLSKPVTIEGTFLTKYKQ